MDQRLIHKPGYHKRVLEENVENKLLDMVFLHDAKGKITKWNYNKLKRFCTAKKQQKTIAEWEKRQPAEKFLANHLSDKVLTLKIYKKNS